MKKLLFSGLAAVSLMPAALSAQEYEYIPFVRDCEFGYYYYGYSGPIDFYHFGIKNDTVINGMDYKKLYQYNDQLTEEFIGCIREQDKKVYLRENGCDSLWYDFTLDVGEQYNGIAFFYNQFSMTNLLEPIPMYYGSEDWGIVDLVDTVDFAGKYRKKIDFGIATMYDGMGIIDIHGDAACVSGFRMHYIIENGEYVYRRHIDPFSNALIEDPYLDGVDGVEDIEASAAPFGVVQFLGRLEITLPGDDCVKASIIDTSGVEIWQRELDGHDSLLTIPTTGLGHGVRVVVITTQSGKRHALKVSL